MIPVVSQHLAQLLESSAPMLKGRIEHFGGSGQQHIGGHVVAVLAREQAWFGAQ